jgi:hypothetical protein
MYSVCILLLCQIVNPSSYPKLFLKEHVRILDITIYSNLSNLVECTLVIYTLILRLFNNTHFL